ncbi:hypothetical protein [Acetobacter malorum]|nr:hypothetical protein [Acetobacter malorum]
MIKRLSFLALFAVPSFAFGQTPAPERPNHMLPQYSAIAAANSNAGTPRAMLRMAAPSAGGYAALWPPGGIRRDTQVPALYADGSAGTLEQMGRMADSSVQQADANKPNGYVQPDASGNMPLPVTGDSSASSVLANSSTFARSLSNRFSDTKNIKDFGVKLDGTDTSNAISSALSSVSSQNEVHIPAGKWVNSVPPFASTYFFNLLGPVANIPNYVLNGNQFDESVAVPDLGDGNTTYMHDSAGNPAYYRIDRSKNANRSLMSLWYLNAYTGAGAEHRGLGVRTGTENGATGNTTGIDSQFYSDGNNGANSFDVNLSLLTRAFGENWSWGIVNQYSELGGLDLSDGTFSHSTSEWDFTGSGPEPASSAAWPGNGSRSLYYTNGWLSCGKCTWSASTAVARRHMAHVTATDGSDSLFVATTGGTTGATQPVWDKTAASITDGSVVWKYLSLYNLQISKVFYLNGTANVHYGAALASDADFYDAALDFSKATYSGGNPSVLRTSAGVGIDWSADGTLSGQNQHTTLYNPVTSSYEYQVNGSPVLGVNDTGMIRSPVSTITATGSSITDATKLPASPHIIITASSAGSGAVMNASGVAVSMSTRITNASNNIVAIYPVDSEWWFDGHPNGAPVYLPQYASIDIMRMVSSSQLEVVYHPANASGGNASKSQILSLVSPHEGDRYYDTSDHAEVTYRCPKGDTNSCAWFQAEYGAALSN